MSLFLSQTLSQLEVTTVWIALILATLYIWTTRTHNFWLSLGVPFKRPVQPFFGNILDAVLGKKSPFLIQKEIYERFKGLPFVGTFDFMVPKLMIREPELIEHVMVKDFPVFMDRGRNVDPDEGSLSAHLLYLTGQKWRNLRHKLTPVFSAGKMKGMMEQLGECTDRLVGHLQSETRKGGPLEAKYQMSGYTLDVIGSCAFGLELRAMDDPQSRFRQIGEKIFAPTRLTMAIIWVRRNIPSLLKLLGLKRLSSDLEDYFTGIIRGTMEYREEQGLQRQDFVQLLIELRNQEKSQPSETGDVLMTDRVITSNAFVFLLAGFETTASTLSFMLYELAVNQDIQERLYQEVREVLRKHNNQLTWDILKEMNYLEMVTSETLRKYPPAGELHRTSLTKYKFPGTSLELPSDTMIAIPVYSLHHDPKYWPQPDKFDPERFSKDKLGKIVKFSYLPFGDGPRICIGMRFAQMEMKIAMIRLIENFQVKLNPKTISPLQLDPKTFLLAPLGGIWLDFTPRTTSFTVSSALS